MRRRLHGQVRRLDLRHAREDGILFTIDNGLEAKPVFFLTVSRQKIVVKGEVAGMAMLMGTSEADAAPDPFPAHPPAESPVRRLGRNPRPARFRANSAYAVGTTTSIRPAA